MLPGSPASPFAFSLPPSLGGESRPPALAWSRAAAAEVEGGEERSGQTARVDARGPEALLVLTVGEMRAGARAAVGGWF